MYANIIQNYRNGLMTADECIDAIETEITLSRAKEKIGAIVKLAASAQRDHTHIKVRVKGEIDYCQYYVTSIQRDSMFVGTSKVYYEDIAKISSGYTTLQF